MQAANTCPQYIRLRDEYEATLREWAKVMRVHDDAAGAAKLAAFDARSEALSKMNSHREFCPTCIGDKQKIGRGSNPRKH
jgi:hypothetical protein